MINLFILFCSMCLQFGALDVPTMILPNFMPSDVISSGFNSMSSCGGIWSYYSDVGLSEDGIFITSFDRIDYFEVKYYVPVQPYISTVSSSYTLSSYATVNNGNFIVGGLNLNGYSCYVYYYYKQNQSSNFGAQQWHNYNNQSFEFSYPVGYSWPVLAYTTSALYYNNELVIVPKDYVVVPEYEGLGSLGSMSSTGHSSDGNPLESLENFSFTGHSPSYIQSGHNTHVNPSLATFDYNNASQNLLGQIIDNTNSLISNTNSLGGSLETINANIINGASAIFNAISQFNSNFVSSVIIDKEELSNQWVTSNTYTAFSACIQSYNLLETTTNNLIDRYSATEDVDELIIPIDLTVWQIESSVFGDFKPFNQVYYMRFGFLDETKALWQPLFISLLYFCLFYGIVLDLPNIIRGVKS